MYAQLTQSDPSDIQLIELVGRLQNNSDVAIQQALDDAMASGRHQIVLDLSGVEYINSAGLRQIVQLYKAAAHGGGHLYLINPSDRVGKLLELVGLDSVVDIRTDPAYSLARLTNGSALDYNRQVLYCS